MDTKDTKSRDQLPGLAGSRLETATRDLFRLNGGQSIPVEARVPAQPAASTRPKSVPAPVPEPPASASGRKPEASIIFSLEALMKSAAPTPSKHPDKDEEIDQQLWNMQAETPLFGTDQDLALLTTPLEPPPRSSTVDSMTVSSRHPGGMRLVPVLIALGAGCVVVLGGAGWWATRASNAQSALVAEKSAAEKGVAAQGAEAPVVEPPAPSAVAVAAPALHPSNPSSGTPAAPTGDSPAAEPAANDPEHKEAAEAAATPSEAEKPAAEKEKEKPRSERVTSARTPSRSPKAILAVPVKSVPFDMAAARDALNGASTKAEACAHTGAGGKGKIQLTFGNNGKVSSASIVDGPFAANTPAGKCALRQFHAAHVPAFTGTPVTVAKSFKIP